MKSILRMGSRGQPVSDLQQMLNKKLVPSPNLKVNGIFDHNTRRSVLAFQRKEWLVQDGEAGPCTIKALQGTEKYKILHPVTLMPQPDSSACWLAATSMLLKQSIPRSSVPPELLTSDGGLLNDSEVNDPVHTRAYATHFGLRMHYPQSWTVTGLVSLLRQGPVATHILWNASGYASGTGSDGHFAVIAGIRGDSTSIGTTLRIYDPWPPNQGMIASFGYHKLMNGTPALTYQLFQK